MNSTSTPFALDHHLSAQDVADRYGVPLQTVRVWRMKGYGPRGFSVGRYVRYRLSECIAFEETQLSP